MGKNRRDDMPWADRARPEMVRWFAPRELIRTSVEVLSAHAVAWFVDPRVVFGGRPRKAGDTAGGGKRLPRRDDASLDDIFKEKKEIWFDYVSDLGDGFDSTYAIARTLAADELRLSPPACEPRSRPDAPLTVTRRADILVLGGDLTYPTPRINNYEERLVAPYNEAAHWDRDDDPPYVLAIPGNHDWYDGLRGFRQLFCRPRGRFAGWRTCQWRSYFAVRLPHDVWLIGADTQLSNAINPDQADYFESVRQEIKAHHRVILCLATPDWLEPHAATGASVLDVMKELLGHDIDVCLAGHRHHYQRHSVIEKDDRVESPDDRAPETHRLRGRDEAERKADGEEWAGARCLSRSLQRITAGGGGTYMSPTHVPVHRSLRNQLHRHASFPPPSDSLRYRRRLFLLPFLEPWFGAIPAVIYALGCCILLGLEADTFEAFRALARDRAETLPGILFVVVLALSTLMLRQRFDAISLLIAVIHSAAHLVGVLLVAYWVLPWQNTWRFLPVVLAGGLGWWLGAAIVGAYLYVASWFDRFVDVGYAALRIDDWKSFLRFHLDENGNLTIYPIGLRRVPRTWSRRAAPDGDRALRPEDPRATAPELIETPILIPARRRNR